MSDMFMIVDMMRLFYVHNESGIVLCSQRVWHRISSLYLPPLPRFSQHPQLLNLRIRPPWLILLLRILQLNPIFPHRIFLPRRHIPNRIAFLLHILHRLSHIFIRISDPIILINFIP